MSPYNPCWFLFQIENLFSFLVSTTFLLLFHKIMAKINPSSPSSGEKILGQDWKEARGVCITLSCLHFLLYGLEAYSSPSWDYYPNLAREFYTNLKHMIENSTLSFLQLKESRLILARRNFAHILGIRDEGHQVTVDTNAKTIEEDLHLSYEATCSRLRIRPCLRDRRAILNGGDFPNIFPLNLAFFMRYTMVPKGRTVTFKLQIFNG